METYGSRIDNILATVVAEYGGIKVQVGDFSDHVHSSSIESEINYDGGNDCLFQQFELSCHS